MKNFNTTSWGKEGKLVKMEKSTRMSVKVMQSYEK
jgi:hypothetical protein